MRIRKYYRDFMKRQVKAQKFSDNKSSKQIKRWFADTNYPYTLHNVTCLAFNEMSLMRK